MGGASRQDLACVAAAASRCGERAMSLSAVFRADAGPEIGIGHVIRCLALAETLRARGFECALATAEAGLAAVPRARLAGIDVLPAAAKRPGADLFVVDHYGLGAAYERDARAWAKCLLAIDDLADRAHDCDLLLDTAIGRSVRDYAGLVPAHCVFLLGQDFAPLRPSFRAARERRLPRERRAARRVLVTLGGTDPKGLTLTVLEGIAQAKAGLEIEVVLPAKAPGFAAVEAKCAALGARLHESADDLAALMAEADFCIGAGGTTAWERACLGLPTLLVATAANQRGNVAQLTRAGAAIAIEPVTAESVACAVTAVAADTDRLDTMSRAAAALCDGAGAERVADAILQRLTEPARRRRAS
jgi:UDP-2,4-diacetamido-2,4,6-trideoxy-beta-L-altropyranose hydrolase